MKLAANVGSIAGLSGYGVPTITGLAYSATALPSGPSVGLSFTSKEGLNSFKGGICVNTFLSAHEREKYLNRRNVGENKWQTITDKFKGSVGTAYGCASILWEKATWSDGNWKGIIRYEWLYMIDVDVIVTYGLFNAYEEDPKIRWRSIYVNKNRWDNGWKTWETTDTTKLPKFSFRGSDGLVFNPDSSRVCPKHSCYGAHQEKQWGEAKWQWREKSYGDHKFADWASNFNEVFDPELINDLNKADWSKLMEKGGIWKPI